MFEILDTVLERAAARGATDVEVYGERSTSHRIKVYRQEVEQLTAAQRRGVGVRVFSGGAVGHAYTSDLSDGALDDVVQRAVDNAAVSDPDEFAALPEPAGEPADVDPFDPRLVATTDEQRIAIALEAEATALAADPRVKTVEDAMYVDGDGEVFIASTAGVRGSYRAGQCYAFAYVLAEQEGQVETGYSYSVGRALEDLDPVFVGNEAAERAARLLGARKCPSMKAPVVLDPFVSAAFFSVLSSALTADAVQKN
ncbi:MAG: TldD/PmbA family protein, partial [Thermoleophilia bacterium]|nr:TldD/PmbA family protein [Thermoleophilia bacterium]